MDVVVLNEESNMPDREKLFLSGKNHYAPILHVLKHPGEINFILIHSIQTDTITNLYIGTIHYTFVCLECQ